MQSDIVYQDALAIAFVSPHEIANNAGNVLVIPSRHFENMYEFQAPLAAGLHRMVKAVALALKAAFACDGVSTRQHNEPVGNQDAWHYHIPLTPRYHKDGLYKSEHTLMPADERAKYAARIRYMMKLDQSENAHTINGVKRARLSFKSSSS